MRLKMITLALFFSFHVFSQNCHVSQDVSGRFVSIARDDQAGIYLNFAEHIVSGRKDRLIEILLNLENNEDVALKDYFSRFIADNQRLIQEIKADYVAFKTIALKNKVEVVALESPETPIALRKSQISSIYPVFKHRMLSLGFTQENVEEVLLLVFNKAYWLMFNHPNIPWTTVALEEDIGLLEKQGDLEDSFNNISHFLSVKSPLVNAKTLELLEEFNDVLGNLYPTTYNDSVKRIQAALELKRKIKKSKSFKGDFEKTYQTFMMTGIDNLVDYVKYRHLRDEQFARILFQQTKPVISVIGAFHKSGTLHFLNGLCQK